MSLVFRRSPLASSFSRAAHPAGSALAGRHQFTSSSRPRQSPPSLDPTSSAAASDAPPPPSATSASASASTSTTSTQQPGRPSVSLEGLRVVPASAAYFSRRPTFMDDLTALDGLVQKYRHLPTLPADEVEPVLWKTARMYTQPADGGRASSTSSLTPLSASAPGEPVSPADYRALLLKLDRLHQIQPELMPAEVPPVLAAFKRVVSPFGTALVARTLDSWGRALGVGHRKTSTARAWVVEGTGEIRVNGRALPDAFLIGHDRETAAWPLAVTDRLDKYNAWVVVEGGGTTGQSVAVAAAIAKALIIHEPGLKPYLRKAGLVTRDVREVERKKPGHLKARKMPTWVKR